MNYCYCLMMCFVILRYLWSYWLLDPYFWKYLGLCKIKYWIILHCNCKNLMDRCARETLRFIVYSMCPEVKSGSGILGHLMEESGAIKPVLRPYLQCRFLLFTLMYVATTGGGKSDDSMTTCSVCSEEDNDNPSCPVCTCFFKSTGPQVPKLPQCSGI